MIKIFIYILLALGLGAYLSIKLAEDPGYVLISFNGYSVEATLVTVLLTLILLFVVVFGLVWLLKKINPLKLLKKDTWVYLFSRGNAGLATEKGLQLLLLGNWQDAYKILVENAAKVPNPVFNYMAASLAAYQRQDKLAWNYCLEQAEKNSKVSVTGIKNLKAILELKSGRVEQSLAILLTLKKEVPDSPYVLRLIKDIYISLADWEQLSLLLPELEKKKIIGEAEIEGMKIEIILYRLKRACESESALQKIKEIWNEAPKKIKSQDKVVMSYLQKLIKLGGDVDALGVLNKHLKQSWSDELVEMIGRSQVKEAAQLLLLLEGWLKDRPSNVMLMLSLARVSLNNSLWAKAQEYLEQGLRASSSIELTAELNGELGRLFENLGESEKSLACYSKSIGLFEKKLPSLPMPVKTR